jgi:hypothetical protein
MEPVKIANEDIKNRTDPQFALEKIRMEMANQQKRLEQLQTLMNKQTDYFDEQLRKYSSQFENVAAIEKRLVFTQATIDLVPKIQQNLFDIRDNQLPSLIEDLRRQLLSKIENSITNVSKTMQATFQAQKHQEMIDHHKVQTHGQDSPPQVKKLNEKGTQPQQ